MKQYPEIMTINQVAEYTHIEVQSVYKMAKRGKIPCAKIAGRWLFKKSILDEWLTQKITKHETVQIFQGPVKINKTKNTPDARTL